MAPSPRTLLVAACALCALACLLPAAALAGGSGGASYQEPPKPTKKARIVHGIAVAPKGAPKRIKAVIAAANQIVRKPYRYGGGHQSFKDAGYDCSGAVSYALHGGKFVASPLDSSSYMSWGLARAGRWITVYSNPGHAYMIVAGLRFDTGYRDSYGKKHGAAPGSGPRWGKARPTKGFTARHPAKF